MRARCSTTPTASSSASWALDMWVRNLEARLARLRNIVAAGLAALALVSTLVGTLVYRMRAAAAAAEERDRRATMDLALARDAAEQSSRAKSAFLAVMSHELRTPLHGIIGYSELIREDLQERGETRMVEDIGHAIAAGHHLTDIISDVLDYSKIEAGRLELNPAPSTSPRSSRTWSSCSGRSRPSRASAWPPRSSPDWVPCTATPFECVRCC
ncbi:MAG: histidine kinase dimerization/phospho-acceptor domain-containing protein [Vicinamibacterales bacterium]